MCDTMRHFLPDLRPGLVADLAGVYVAVVAVVMLR